MIESYAIEPQINRLTAGLGSRMQCEESGWLYKKWIDQKSGRLHAARFKE